MIYRLNYLVSVFFFFFQVFDQYLIGFDCKCYHLFLIIYYIVAYSSFFEGNKENK